MEDQDGADLMKVLLSVQQHFQVRIAEWLMAAITFSWGVHLLCYTDVYLTNPIFSDIRDWIGQQVLGFLCLGLGSFRAILLIINGAWRRSPHLRAAFAGVTAFFWLEMCFGLYHSSKHPILLPTIAWFILLEIWSVFRAESDAKLASEATRARVEALRT